MRTEHGTGHRLVRTVFFFFPSSPSIHAYSQADLEWKVPFWKCSSRLQKANLSLPVQKEGSNKGQEGVGKLPECLWAPLLCTCSQVLAQSVAATFLFNYDRNSNWLLQQFSILEGEGLSVLEIMALVLHLWDVIWQWFGLERSWKGKGKARLCLLGEGTGNVGSAGVSSLVLWVKLEEALCCPSGIWWENVETHLAQACSALEHGLTLMVLSFLWCDVG